MKNTKKVSNNTKWLIILAVVVAILALATFSIWRVRYAPTGQRMSIKEYYGISGDGAALFVNGKQIKKDGKAAAKVSDGHFYIELSSLKSSIDDGYVYDSTEQILRYTTDKEVISVNKGDTYYTSGRTKSDLKEKIIITGTSDKPYVAVDFVKKFTDIKIKTAKDPERIVVEKAGYKKKVTTLKNNTQARRFGGPKSKILADVKRGTEATVIESYGKWVKILTADGIEGCVMSSTIDVAKPATVANSLPERSFKHIKMDGKVNILWHQVTNRTANTSVNHVLSNAKGVNVISPTWFRVSDNKGSISDIASLDYVKAAHDKGVQVWGLVSNFENKGIDSTLLLNKTSSRDNLINNLIGKAISYDLDGINVDFEQIQTDAKDGYSEFIKELSLKCKKNDIVLSVDNYPPTNSSAHYNRKVQAQYADYCIVMAYDEHYQTNGPGSNSSLDFVKKAVKNTLKEVPKSRLILALPFYAKVWTTKNDAMTVKSIAMKNISSYLKENNVQETWDDSTGQNYAEFSKGGAKIQLWSEDEKSLSLKLQVMKSNDLAGVAFWKEGFEDSSIWNVIGNYTK